MDEEIRAGFKQVLDRLDKLEDRIMEMRKEDRAVLLDAIAKLNAKMDRGFESLNAKIDEKEPA